MKNDETITVEVKGYFSRDEIEESKDFDARKVKAEFKEKGINVSLKAILHNYDCWLTDYKSGYVDKKNGIFLSTPCGCNPLFFHAEKYTGKDYQKTYWA